MNQTRQLFRSRNNRMVAGVCAGLANFFGMDPTVVRLLFVLGVILGYGVLFLVYLVMFLVVPEEPVSLASIQSSEEPSQTDLPNPPQ